jgi:hypothetical protein
MEQKQADEYDKLISSQLDFLELQNRLLRESNSSLEADNIRLNASVGVLTAEGSRFIINYYINMLILIFAPSIIWLRDFSPLGLVKRFGEVDVVLDDAAILNNPPTTHGHEECAQIYHADDIYFSHWCNFYHLTI